jgi:hypothetical protein
MQLQSISMIPEEKRVLHGGSSGNLTKITSEMNNKYGPLMNYVFVVKRLDTNSQGVQVAEVISSRHDTHRAGQMFHLLKHNFLKLPSSQGRFKFRLVIFDMSWALVHGFLEIANLETAVDFAFRVLRYSRLQEETARDKERSWLASCLSHTMHRFTRLLRRKVCFC